MTLSTSSSLSIKKESNEKRAISFKGITSERLGTFLDSVASAPKIQDGGRLTKFFKMLPKVELHAHLNGCIRESTLFELAAERNITLSSLLHDFTEPASTTRDGVKRKDEYLRHENKKRRSLSECFKIFSEISKCVTDLDAIARITGEALDDFAKENVAYLELRSTPKSLSQKSSCDSGVISKCTKREYVETILRVMEDFASKEQKRYERERRVWDEENTIDSHGNDSSFIIRPPLTPRFIISIDRAGTIDDANEHVALAIEYLKEKNPFIVGLDLSGDPTKNDMDNLKEPLQRARDAGLKTAIHCGEIPCAEHIVDGKNDSMQFALREAQSIISFQPDRLGHALLLPQAVLKNLYQRVEKIPIECCPTSNVMTLELTSQSDGNLIDGLRNHPNLASWLSNDYPISVSTDDPGIFQTDSTRELMLLKEAFDMKPVDLVRLVLLSVQHIFETDHFKEKLRYAINEQIKNIIQYLNNGAIPKTQKRLSYELRFAHFGTKD